MAEDQLLSKEQACVALGISIHVLDRARRDGLLQETRVGRRVHFTQEQLAEYRVKAERLAFLNGPHPPRGTPVEDVDAWLKHRGIDVDEWPDPTPEQIEELRRLFGYDRHPLGR